MSETWDLMTSEELFNSKPTTYEVEIGDRHFRFIIDGGEPFAEGYEGVDFAFID
jgi:hypothetical protein